MASSERAEVDPNDWATFNEVVVPWLGKADWLYERDDPIDPGTNILEGMHVPCCSVLIERNNAGYRPTCRPCHNGPLTGDQIRSGDCGEHGPVGPEIPSASG